MWPVRWIITLCVVAVCMNGAQSQCSGLQSFSLTSTTVSTVSIDNPYSNYMNCQWQISVSSGYKVFLRIEYLHLESNYDFLSIYDGTSASANLLYYSLNSGNTIFLSSSTNLYLRFTSDYSITYGGFSLQLVAVDRSTLPACTSTITASSTLSQLSYVTSQGSNCYYVITASASTNRIDYRVLVAESGLLRVNDGSDMYLSSGSSQYVSSSSSITVYSDNQYVMNYQEVASSVTASIVTSTSAPEFSICTNSGSTLTATSSTEYVTSPNYPASYYNYLYCFVTITAATSSSSVFLYVDDWEVDYSDYLNIYDGVSVAYNLEGSAWFAGSSVNSTGRSLHVAFSTGYSGTLRGFKLRYTEIARATPTCASSYTQYSASSTSSVISSTGYPSSSYTNALDEYWLIVKPTETDNLVLDVTFMDIEGALDCAYDSLTFYDGPCTTSRSLAIVCGSTPVTFEDASGIYILVRFKTDASVVQRGFSLTFYTGTFIDTDDDSDGLPDWIIPLIVLVVIICIVTGIGCFFWCRMQRSKRLAKIHNADGATPARPKLARKLTTHQLLIQFKTQLEDDKNKKKIKRKPSRQSLGYQQPQHLPPNPAGPNTVILNRGQMIPHPPPPQPQPHPQFQPQPPPVPPPGSDPVYPPSIFGGDGSIPKPVGPGIHGGQLVPPPGFTPMNTDLNAIPLPFQYITPAEARAAREAQAGLQA